MEEYYVNLSKSTLSSRMSLISIQVPGTEVWPAPRVQSVPRNNSASY